MSDKGASNNERLLYAAKQDDEELLEEIFEQPESFDINYADGLGNTALHYAAQHGSINVIEPILEHDDCDVDLQNRLDGATPLHLAVRIPNDVKLRHAIISALLDAGADTTIRDKHRSFAVDLLPGDDTEGKQLFRTSQAKAAVSQDDVADDSDGEPGSGSEED